ncbi:MAG: hypothetical protein INH37_12305 [Myxococcaceae bacterium]|nr:hypothetical protein [Myxococcaceae bacterium]
MKREARLAAGDTSDSKTARNALDELADQALLALRAGEWALLPAQISVGSHGRRRGRD